jgi:hypothetical protein
MLTKSLLIAQMDKLPEQFSIDELIDRLILIEKVNISEKQSENGEVISEVEMKDKINRWFK